jgi:hypothetical protein
VHDLGCWRHQRLCELDEVAQPLLPGFALDRRYVPRLHLRALLAKQREVAFDLRDGILDQLRTEPRLKRIGSALGHCLFLVGDLLV